jgi:RimJ/RimL family protein N-acetyltransferase
MREPIVTNRLILRDIAEADAEALFDLDSDPDVMRYIGPRPADDVESYRDRIRSVYLPYHAHPWHGVRTVRDRDGGTFLGWVFVRPALAARFAAESGWNRPDEVEIGYRYHRSVWGRGIATEAAMPLIEIALAVRATPAVVGRALASNLGSLRVLEKLGLTRVGEVILPDFAEAAILLARRNSGAKAAAGS